MDIFNISEQEMRDTSSVCTLREICQQPATWKKTCAALAARKKELKEFLAPAVFEEKFEIVLTGAGTSAFIGNALCYALNRTCGHRVRSCATTDIVPSPESCLSRTRPTLLVSFGRSGNSPESVGAVEAAEAVCRKLFHLFVTCNREGALSRRAEGRANCLALNLPEETHDQSFAMTSSYSNMYLAAYLAFHLDCLEELSGLTDRVCRAASDFLEHRHQEVRRIAEDFDFDRIVYLGNLELKGVAQESALKMLELTAGKVTAMYDSPLGFRHGPKSVIDERTLTVLYMSDDAYCRQYEIDLLKEMGPQRKGNRIAAVYNTPCGGLSELVDYEVPMGTGQPLENIFLGLGDILFAQTLAVMKALCLGTAPDNPCPTGEVNRVVKGVTIYPYTGK